MAREARLPGGRPHAGRSLSRHPRRAAARVVVWLALLGLAACSDTQAAGKPVSDRPLDAFQSELLDLAFQAASALPVDPHVKTRARLQESVVRASFDLQQPRRALRYAEVIDNWRKGMGYAEFALYCAQRGDTSEVQRYLDLASQVAEAHSKDESAQDWPRDRIRAAIGRTHLVLGQSAAAEKLGIGLVATEAGALDVERFKRIDARSFDELASTLQATLANGDFDRAHSALKACVELYDRFHADSARAARLKLIVSAPTKRLPSMVRLDTLLDMCDRAAAHGQSADTLELAEHARQALESSSWLPEDRAPRMARLAAARFRAGDRERARRDLDAALAAFDTQRERVVDIRRAGVLRPIAEAYHSIGDTRSALAVYKRAIGEGIVNPNSRPRAEDLVATCCSMARCAIVPDAALRARVVEVRGGLGHPW